MSGKCFLANQDSSIELLILNFLITVFVKSIASHEDRKYSLSEPKITFEQADMSCSSVLYDPALVKDCISYVMVGRDLEIDYLRLNEFHPELLF
mmetsp:Transcript_24822/g.61043  ORF Transcript_24822/g.61043 Transcript_24822/m.61043 type:complete len:94 (+) Transcript_24822:71-352(+)